MLKMRPNCECCDQDLPADGREAMVCSFECTFCIACSMTHFGGRCPNCKGELQMRPLRARALWARFPPSDERIVKAHLTCVAIE